MGWLIARPWRGYQLPLAELRQCFAYAPGDNRATGYLLEPGGDWRAPLRPAGARMLSAMAAEFGIQFPIVAFQAYRNGSGCGWHADTPFGAQAILSLGVTRTFGVRRKGGEPAWYRLAHGDVVYMPPGFQQEWEHCVPEEDVTGERISLVFRTKA